PAAPRPRKSRRKLWLSLLAAGVAAVLLVVGYTAVRFLVDLGTYDDGHAAYERADCAAAVAEYDSVINGWRLVTLGDTVRRAESEKAECLVFREAADRQQAGNGPGALAAYAQFVPGRPQSPLTDAARKRVTELFAGPDLAKLATVESCDALDVMRTEKLLVAESAPGFHAACGAAFAQAHQTTKAVTTYARLFTDYGDHQVAAETEAKVAADTAWCLELDRVRADPVLSVRGGLLSGLLATCATAPTTPDSVAKKNAEELLQKYPGHPRTAEVLAALARLINKAAREVPGANDIGPAQLTRSVGGNEAVIMVYNDSDDPLQVAFSGPQPRVETIDPCPSCTIKPPGDNICRDAATLKRIVVAAGEYDVAFTTPDDEVRTRDAFAHWSLQPGKEYFACLVTTQEG
ncbi:MAG TPA: hypothetical protein VFT95_00115, partial [Micromonosporaceae bacterium]|nr:hypothetical protein [Micromonosporaceae bacterium]